MWGSPYLTGIPTKTPRWPFSVHRSRVRGCARGITSRPTLSTSLTRFFLGRASVSVYTEMITPGQGGDHYHPALRRRAVARLRQLSLGSRCNGKVSDPALIFPLTPGMGVSIPLSLTQAPRERQVPYHGVKAPPQPLRSKGGVARATSNMRGHGLY